MLRRTFPESAPLMDKEHLAATMIEQEVASFGSQGMLMSESCFGELPWNAHARRVAAGHILRGLLIRGRLQAAAFDVFMQLCRQGVCSLSSLEHPVDWVHTSKGDCFKWIRRMLCVFGGVRSDWHALQRSWGIPSTCRWHDYLTPLIWLATMIGRSFTSLDVVFDIIRLKDQLGRVDSDQLKALLLNQPDPDWKSDINLNRSKEWYGSMTFACWLPEAVDPSIIQQGFDDAAIALGKEFYSRLERVEMHYAKFFDISKDVFDADVQRGERDIRDWVRES
ncbi:hypothetical protein V498_00542 [Pseudogymnoascus sp. VKM F-4517 (FW-2822)]|nr:hypothetical protein V498_00542 [Pseudogymnoascus sp. VKM F-4517 (FW-2822)]